MNREYPPAAKGHTGLLYDDLSWLQPDLNQLPELSRYNDLSVSWRLYQITELSEGKAAGRRLAMENVVASLRHSNSAFVYVLSGNASGIKLHIGVASDSDQAGEDIPDTAENLKSIFEGNFPGTRLRPIRQENREVQTQLETTRHMGLVTGVPSCNEDEAVLEGEEFQGIERLVSSLCGENWIMVITASPVSEHDIIYALDQAYGLSTELSSLIKRSVQQSANSGIQSSESTGTSTSDAKGGQRSDTFGSSHSKTQGQSTSESTGYSESNVRGRSESESSGWSHSDSRSQSKNISRGSSKGASSSDSKGNSRSTTTSDGTTTGKSSGSSTSSSSGTSTNKTSGTSSSVTKGTSTNTTSGTSSSVTTGTNTSQTEGTNWSRTEGTNASFSASSSRGSSIALTSEVVDKRFEDIQGHLNDTVIKRLRIGQGKGMYNTSVYVGANKHSVYERLAQGVLSIFQGNQASMTPLRVHKLNHSGALQLSSLLTGHPLPQNEVSSSQALIHSIPLCLPQGLLAATRLTADELVLMTGLPTREQPGVKIRHNVDFAPEYTERF